MQRLYGVIKQLSRYVPASARGAIRRHVAMPGYDSFASSQRNPYADEPRERLYGTLSVLAAQV